AKASRRLARARIRQCCTSASGRASVRAWSFVRCQREHEAGDPATTRRIVCGGNEQGQKASTVQGRNGKMRIRLRALAAVGAMLPLIMGADAALAQKSGGILKVYHRDNPPSASIHEEATNSTVMPFMNVY